MMAEARSPHNQYVFPGKARGKGLSNNAMAAVLKRMSRADITVHGFRSTFRDWASEQTSFPHEACENALAHRISDKAEAAYRRGDQFEKRRKLMEAWQAFADSKATANVIPPPWLPPVTAIRLPSMASWDRAASTARTPSVNTRR